MGILYGTNNKPKPTKPKPEVAGATTNTYVQDALSGKYGSAAQQIAQRNTGFNMDAPGSLDTPGGPDYSSTIPLGSDGKPAQTLQDVVSGRSSARTTPASMSTSTSKTSRTPALGGKTANSAGSYYGSAGQNTMETSFDSAGNPIYGTLGGKNIIGGQGSRVDRTAGISSDPMSQYMALFSPQTAIDRQAQIRKEMAKERQQQIDAIELSAKQAVSAEQQAGAQDLARQRSMNLRSGLGGSDFGAANKAEIRTRTNENVRGIEAQKDMAIGGVIDTIEQLAQQRFQLQEQSLQQGFENMFQVQEYEQAQRKEAVSRIAELGKAGLDIATIKERDPQMFESLKMASDMGEVELEAVLNNNKPAPAKIDYQTMVRGGKIMMFGVDPTTGTMKMIEQEVNMPDNYKTLQADDGTILGIPEDWDGDTSKIVTVGNYRKPFASEMGGGTGAGGATTDPVVDSWVNLISTGQATITNVPANLKNAVASALQGATAGAGDPQKTRDQISFLKTTVSDALQRAKASGPSGISKKYGDLFIGDTPFRQLEALTNTLRTNVLALMTDPSIKKFFGPQMSNADVQLMTATGTTLNPENMSPTMMKQELERLQELFNRMESAIPQGGSGGGDDIDAFLNSF